MRYLSFIHLFIYSFIHLFIYSFIHLLIYSFIHEFCRNSPDVHDLRPRAVPRRLVHGLQVNHEHDLFYARMHALGIFLCFPNL